MLTPTTLVGRPCFLSQPSMITLLINCVEACHSTQVVSKVQVTQNKQTWRRVQVHMLNMRSVCTACTYRNRKKCPPKVGGNPHHSTFPKMQTLTPTTNRATKQLTACVTSSGCKQLYCETRPVSATVVTIEEVVKAVQNASLLERALWGNLALRAQCTLFWSTFPQSTSKVPPFQMHQKSQWTI